jgi:hypothetical protein
MRTRSFLLVLLAAIACCISAAQDLPPVNAPFAIATLVTRQGPLAVSGDGRWRVHVDAANVLESHQARLENPDFCCASRRSAILRGWLS